MNTMSNSAFLPVRMQYVSYAQAQRQSVTVVIPKPIRLALGIKAGDVVIFDIVDGYKKVWIHKMRGEISDEPENS